MMPARRLATWLPVALVLGVTLWLLLDGDSARRSAAPNDGNGTGSTESRAIPWLDREVDLPVSPRRVIPGASAAVDLMAALGCRDLVVAWPADAGRYAEVGHDPAWTNLPVFVRFSAEALIAHAPDLVIASPWNNSEAKVALRQRDVPVLDLPTLENLDQVRTVVRELGDLLGVRPAADRLIASLHDRERELLARAALRTKPWTVLAYSTYAGAGHSPGRGTSFDEVMRLAGCRNATALDGHSGHVTMTFERLLAIDPEVIVVPARGLEGGSVGAFLKGTPQLRDLRALREGRVIEIEARLVSANSQLILDAADALATRLAALEVPAEGAPGGR